MNGFYCGILLVSDQLKLGPTVAQCSFLHDQRQLPTSSVLWNNQVVEGLTNNPTNRFWRNTFFLTANAICTKSWVQAWTVWKKLAKTLLLKEGEPGALLLRLASLKAFKLITSPYTVNLIAFNTLAWNNRQH